MKQHDDSRLPREDYQGQGTPGSRSLGDLIPPGPPSAAGEGAPTLLEHSGTTAKTWTTLASCLDSVYIFIVVLICY